MTKKKAPKKKAAPKKAVKAVKKAAPTSKARRSRPQSQPLPGFEQVLHSRLDRLCEGIAEVRTEMNEQRTIEGEKCRAALIYMHDHKVTTYRFAGVELVRVPGEEKLRVRTTKESATLESDDEGTGQDAGQIAEALTKGDTLEDADDPSPVVP